MMPDTMYLNILLGKIYPINVVCLRLGQNYNQKSVCFLNAVHFKPKASRFLFFICFFFGFIAANRLSPAKIPI